jgi:sterol desaturase/sphingolipid hydroxylase (fatty acid hydroxylase superfamily)
MDPDTILLATGGFLAGAFAASLVEYWVHVLMHRRILLGRTHRNHHLEPDGETWFKQFAYYALGCAVSAAVIVPVCWVLGVLPLGLGVTAGSVAWSAWVAYAHTLQHERPELVFWMRLPIHHLHHKYEMSRHNFGLSVDWWDRVFGTYKPVPWAPDPTVRRSLWGLFRIPWF